MSTYYTHLEKNSFTSWLIGEKKSRNGSGRSSYMISADAMSNTGVVLGMSSSKVLNVALVVSPTDCHQISTRGKYITLGDVRRASRKTWMER